IGADCCISQGVTIGVSGRGEMRGVPVVGNRVYFGVNAVVVGKIYVGDDVLIGANSLVNRDVPEHCTVLGVPAVITSEKGSEGYLVNTSVSQPPIRSAETIESAAELHSAELLQARCVKIPNTLGK